MDKIDVNAPSDNNLIQRAIAKTPPFWRKVRTLMASIAGVSGSMLLSKDILPPDVVTVVGYVFAMSTFGMTLAQLTKK